jgi:hypothetical protein
MFTSVAILLVKVSSKWQDDLRLFFNRKILKTLFNVLLEDLLAEKGVPN